MSRSDPHGDIPSTGGCARLTRDFGHVRPLLNEIRHALQRLAVSGETTRIDLSAMPCGPRDLEQLTDWLGAGEVEAKVEALGPTLIRETAFAGVWLVDYQTADGVRQALHLEIALVPEILRSRPEDLAEAIDRLDARLQDGQSSPPLMS